MLLSLISYGVCRLIPPATAATASTGSPLWQPGVGARTGGAGPACAATSRGALLAFADYLLVALALPQTVVVCPHRGHRYPGLRRFGSMAGRTPEAHPHGGGQSGGTRLCGAPARQRAHWRGGLSDGGCPSRRPPTMRAPSLPPSTASPHSAASLASGIFAALDTINGNTEPSPSSTATSPPHSRYAHTPAGRDVHLSSDRTAHRWPRTTKTPTRSPAAQVADDYGVRIYTVGIGSPAGVPMHVNGFTVQTQLDEATLQQIAQLTDGTLLQRRERADLLDIFET